MKRPGIRVLVVGPFPVDDRPVGGVETALSGLVTGLAQLDGIDHVHVADVRAGVVSCSTRQTDRLTVHRIPAQTRLRLLNGAHADLRRLRELVKVVQPHIAHGQGVNLGGGLATRLGVPSVVTVHGMVHVEARALSNRGLADGLRVALVERSVKRIVARADAIISISDYDRAGILRFGPVPRHSVIPNAVVAPCSKSNEPLHPTALYPGLIIPRKNILGMVRAFQAVRRTVPDARLIIAGAVGDQAYAKEVFSLIESDSDGIEYVGSLDRNALGEVMRRAGLLVMFSHQETLPCSIAEAMLCARPVVSSAVGGVAEMVTEGVTGRLVDAGDEAALEGALTELLTSTDLRVRMGRDAREFASQHYAPSAVAARTMEVYQRVLEGR